MNATEKAIVDWLRERGLSWRTRGDYAEYAQAALAAIRETHVLAPREPTEAMCEAGEPHCWHDGDPADVYTAMIEAAEGNG